MPIIKICPSHANLIAYILASFQIVHEQNNSDSHVQAGLKYVKQFHKSKSEFLHDK